MSKNLHGPRTPVLDHPDQLQRHGDTIVFDLWYPGGGTSATYIEVGLCHVRAADTIRIHYDMTRDGYVIEQASRPGDPHTPDWQEVAFIHAWAREEAKKEASNEATSEANRDA